MMGYLLRGNKTPPVQIYSRFQSSSTKHSSRSKNVAQLPERPWSVEDIDAAFVVKDSAGQKLAYVYYEEGPLMEVRILIA